MAAVLLRELEAPEAVEAERDAGHAEEHGLRGGGAVRHGGRVVEGGGRRTLPLPPWGTMGIGADGLAARRLGACPALIGMLIREETWLELSVCV